MYWRKSINTHGKRNKKIKLKSLSLLLGFMILCTTITYGKDTITVSDISKTSYGEMLRDFGIIHGDGKGKLNEDAFINRGEMITIINRLTDVITSNQTETETPTFLDVPRTHWAYVEVEQAYKNKVTKGIGNHLFGINNYVTYEQALAFLIRVLGFEYDYSETLQIAEEELNIQLNTVQASDYLYRSEVFELLCNCLFTKTKDDILLVESLKGYSEEDRRVLEESFNSHHVLLSELVLPKLHIDDFTDVAVNEKEVQYVQERISFQQEHSTFIALFQNETFELQENTDSLYQILNPLDSKNVRFKVESTGIYDGVVDSLFYSEQDIWLNEKGEGYASVRSYIGSGYIEFNEIKVYRGIPVIYDNKRVVPYLLMGNMFYPDKPDKIVGNSYQMILVYNNKFFKGISDINYGDGYMEFPVE